MPGVGVFPDGRANIGSDGLRHVQAVQATGSGEHQIEHCQLICIEDDVTVADHHM